MNTLRFANWMSERGWPVKCFFVAGTKLFDEALKSCLPVFAVRRNKKYFDIANAARLARLFRKENVNVVWYRDNRDLSVLGWVKRFSGNCLHIIYQQAMQLGVSKRDIIHTVRFRQIDAWVAPLSFLAEQVLSKTHFFENRIHTIPLAVDAKKFSANPASRAEARTALGLANDKKWMGMIGRLDVLKGQHLAIEALAQLAETHPSLHLCIAGESTLNEGDEYEKRLHKMATEYNLQNRIVFMPFMNAVENFYRAIDIFILGSEGETFGMVTIEAMASGCAVVGTNASGTPEILGNGKYGMLFEPGNARQLAMRIAEMLNDVQQMHVLSKSGMDAAIQNYSHDNVCERIEAEVLWPLLNGNIHNLRR